MAMVSKSVFTLLLVFVTYGSILCQDAEEPSLGTDFEGSGNDFADLASLTGPDSPPELEEVESKASIATSSDNLTNVCEICTCSEEGVGEDYTITVDCSHQDLTEVPAGINDSTTNLNLQFNKLEVLPKSIASLKNLRVLNVNDNSIKELEFGSISYLSELKELNLENNRLLEIPQELKNSFGLTKLKTLNLNGNDIRELSVDNFSQFKELEILKVLEVTDELVHSLCSTLNDSLLKVCRNDECLNCEKAADEIPDEYFLAVHPGMIAADVASDDVGDTNNTATNQNMDNAITTTLSTPLLTNDTSVKTDNTTEFSLRAAVDKEIHSRKASSNRTEETDDSKLETDKKKEDMKVETDVQVEGEEKPKEKSGGVSNLVIGLVVAAMVLVIAVVVIRKNWGSVRNTFSSSPRSASERLGNGTAPEEMPLREKPNPV